MHIFALYIIVIYATRLHCIIYTNTLYLITVIVIRYNSVSRGLLCMKWRLWCVIVKLEKTLHVISSLGFNDKSVLVMRCPASKCYTCVVCIFFHLTSNWNCYNWIKWKTRTDVFKSIFYTFEIIKTFKLFKDNKHITQEAKYNN